MSCTGYKPPLHRGIEAVLPCLLGIPEHVQEN
jgi:hypothetical protein